MKRIIGKRGSGKTTELIKMCAEKGGYIVCRASMVDVIAGLANNMNLNIAYPLSYGEYIGRRYHGTGVKRVYIDDIDALAVYISAGVDVECVTMQYDEFDQVWFGGR